MELDDLKNTWSQYDKKLSDNIRLNEELLRKLNLNTTKKEMQKMLLLEILNVIISVLIILFALSIGYRFMDQWQLGLPAFILAVVTCVYLSFGIIRTKKLMNIDYYGSPIVKVQRDILMVKKKNLLFRKYELILLPLLLLPFIPILFKLVHNIDIYQETKLLIIETLLALGLGYPLTIWVYKYFYDKKFKNAENLLAELDEFEKEL